MNNVEIKSFCNLFYTAYLTYSKIKPFIEDPHEDFIELQEKIFEILKNFSQKNEDKLPERLVENLSSMLETATSTNTDILNEEY